MKEFDKQRPVQEAVSDGVIEGRNAVIEALRAGCDIVTDTQMALCDVYEQIVAVTSTTGGA